MKSIENNFEDPFITFLNKIDGIEVVSILENEKNYQDKIVLVPHDLEKLKIDILEQYNILHTTIRID